MTDAERLQQLIDNAEKAYDGMYEVHDPSGATACYSDAKESLHDAIALATRLGHVEKAAQLTERLDHIKAVFRSQFG